MAARCLRALYRGTGGTDEAVGALLLADYHAHVRGLAKGLAAAAAGKTKTTRVRSSGG